MMSNNAAAVVEYVREMESVPSIIQEYGNTGEYARKRWNCSPAICEIIREKLETGTGKRKV